MTRISARELRSLLGLPPRHQLSLEPQPVLERADVEGSPRRTRSSAHPPVSSRKSNVHTPEPKPRKKESARQYNRTKYIPSPSEKKASAILKRGGVILTPRELGDLRAKKEAVSKDIDQILATVLDASSCAICLDVVAHPFSIACGHSYCAPCLREYIAVELRVKKLPAIQEDRIVGHKHHPSACSTVPSTLAQLLSLEEAIEDHGFNAAETLAYPCPECKQAFHTAPHRNEALGRLLSGVFKLHKDRIAATGRSIASNPLPANVFSDEPFLGLFHSGTRTVD
ncbi:hypothetical protein BKA70DRAFT_1229245 [Coprinopsis sp. MPI-PUGE-AT-0042]|nr:hypothetical protein BKA70DRAFT_1229245 [Coprinopsis sp. MPI-PUGE-AT-0042]